MMHTRFGPSLRVFATLALLLLSRIETGIHSFSLPTARTTPFAVSVSTTLHNRLGRMDSSRMLQLLPCSIRSSSSSTLILRQSRVQPEEEEDHENHEITPEHAASSTSEARVRRWRRRIHKTALSVLFTAAVWQHGMRGGKQAAHARYSYEIQDNPTYSIRPGMSRDQASLMEEGTLDVKELDETATSVFDNNNNNNKPEQSAAALKKAKRATLVDYGDEDDQDDADFLDEDDLATMSATTTAGSISQSDQAMAERLQAKTRDQFASYQTSSTSSKTTRLKVGLAFFLPTYGFLIIREYVRRRREENYVQKGLEIQAAQKAEYFNVTATSDDSDVQDALKGLKKNTTSTDDEDDDDDDDDEIDEDAAPKAPKRPRQPRGDGPRGDSGPSSSGGGDGDAPPSAEDLERLNNMFKRS